MYPENAKPTIIIDDEGACSGCRYHESRQKLDVDWDEREEMFRELVDEAKATAKERGNAYDCIIPVSGGKDSHYQVWLLKEKYGLNPLLVTFNHGFNTPAGNRNLRNLVEKSGCDAIRVTAGKDSVKKIAKYMLKKVGDITWHYHAGIRTVPIQIAVEKNIPLIVWGEHGFAELTGIVSLEDFVEFTRWTRKEHDMRGIEAHELIGHNNITEHDIAPYIYPSDEEIERVEIKGIYISNFFNWDAKAHAELMIKEWDFAPITYKRNKSFNLHGKIEDHANDVHDYMKYLKFGYGRATDDASIEIRHGRMTREEGKRLVKEYDSQVPQTLQFYCDFLGITIDEFYRLVEPMREAGIWAKNNEAKWVVNDAIWGHDESGDSQAKNAVIELVDKSNRTFSENNQNMYFNPDNPPAKSGDKALDEFPNEFEWL